MKKLPYRDETLSIRKRICLWLATQTKEFTTADVRKALNFKKPRASRSDRVSEAITIIAWEGKLTRGLYRDRLRLYKKVEGLEFDECAKSNYRRAEKDSEHETKLAPGILGVITHRL